jgi:hypothetical protein
LGRGGGEGERQKKSQLYKMLTRERENGIYEHGPKKQNKGMHFSPPQAGTKFFIFPIL